VWLALNRDGVRVARCTVERLMKALGLHGARRGRTMRTTSSDPAAPRPADLVERDFNPSRPDALCVADFGSRADLGRVRLRGVRRRRVQPAEFSHALPGTQLDRSFTFGRCVHDRKANSCLRFVAK
jgi:transposase InsO family protein